jgi:hypothetical protein
MLGRQKKIRLVIAIMHPKSRIAIFQPQGDSSKLNVPTTSAESNSRVVQNIYLSCQWFKYSFFNRHIYNSLTLYPGIVQSRSITQQCNSNVYVSTVDLCNRHLFWDHMGINQGRWEVGSVAPWWEINFRRLSTLESIPDILSTQVEYNRSFNIVSCRQ